VRIANLVTAGDFWRRISGRMVEDTARRGGASVESYHISYPPGLAGTSQLTLAITDMLHVNAGLRASEEGCDALFVNAVPDYGVPLLRASLPIPVIGAGESSMLVARSLGRRFSIVTAWPESSHPMYDRLLSQTGMASYCASVVYTLTDEEASSEHVTEYYAAMATNEESLLDRLERSCLRAFDEDGADTVILGCTCMHPVAEELARRFDRPVLDPVMVGWRFAQLAVDFVPPGGRAGRGAPLPHRDAFRSVLGGAPEMFTDSECAICEVAAVSVTT
jgi:allantoin racemase